jgi:fructokinase
MRMRYAAVLGEALIDLLEGECGGERVYRPAVGGAPLNVAVGVARLGGAAEYVGSLSTDALGARIRSFLVDAGVGTVGAVAVPVPTTLALTTFVGAEPEFAFYGDSHGRLGPADVDKELISSAAVVYCGSIALLSEPALAAARVAWAVPGPRKVFDPNVRPRLLGDLAAYREVVEEFAAGADLVKLSAADAAVLWGGDLSRVIDRLGALAAAVVVTRGAAGALVHRDGTTVEVPAPAVEAVDATGAGDATMAGLVYALLVGAAPRDWVAATRFAVAVAALTCEGPGGATAMPTLPRVRQRFPAAVQPLPESSA